MDKEEREYFDDMWNTFATPGWKRIVADATDSIEMRKERLLRAQSIDEVRHIQGEVIQLQIIKDMEQMLRNAYEMLSAPAVGPVEDE